MTENSMSTYHEKPVQIIVNGRATLTLMTHAENPLNLVVGVLFTERVIASVSDIDSILTEENQVSVVTKNPYAILLSRKTVLAGCGGASSFLDSGTLGEVVPVPVPEPVIMASVEKVAQSVWFSAGLFSADGIHVSSAEDISLQNAVDTLIGDALQKGVSPERCFAVLLGNCSVETMRKLIIAKIPLAVISGAITDAAVSAASAAGVKIIRL